MNNRKLIPLLVYLAVLILVFSWVTGMTSTVNSDLAYSELVGLFEKEQVQEFTVKGNTIVLTLNTPYNGKSQIRANLAQPESFRQEMEETFRQQRDSGVLKRYDFIPEKSFSAYDIVLPIVIAGAVLMLLWMFIMGRMNGGNPLTNFGKARTVLGVLKLLNTFTNLLFQIKSVV